MDENSILAVASLIGDAQAISGGLLSGDLQEARFRTSLIAGEARLLGLADVEAGAKHLGRLLGAMDQVPSPGYAEAVRDLSLALDRALTLALP
jgi:hypothetical protein